jgi:hypothetical protein
MRFKNQTELAAHLDALFAKHQHKQHQRESKMTFRQWYCRESQWLTDFGSLRVSGDTGADDKSAAQGGWKAGAGAIEGGVEDSSATDLEMVVPADEHFTRCPVSHEAFVPEWDPEEGDYMYRNAVKVLVTEDADYDLFEECQETSHPAIRYAIVHQKLVMEGWLSAGKAATLSDTLKRVGEKYSGGASGVGSAIREALSTAADDEDPEDIFVRLDPSGLVGESLLSAKGESGSSGSREGGGEDGMEEGVAEAKED